MAEDANAPVFSISDPYNVPVTYADNLMASGPWNGLISLTFSVNRLSPVENRVDNDVAIVARLRLDVHCATMLRDRLNVLIATLTKPEGQPN